MRLNGTPSQMFTKITASRATSGEFSHGIGVSMRPIRSNIRLSTPLSCSMIARHAAVPAMIGISQGRRNSARSTPFSGKFLWKNRASSIPSTNWPISEPIVNSTVFAKALVKTSSATTAA